MTPAQAVAFVSAVASHHGVGWSTPRVDRAYGAVRSLAEHHLLPEEAERYLAVLEARRVSERPLVSKELVRAVRWPAEGTTETGTRSRGGRRKHTHPARSAEELVEQRRGAASREWYDVHAQVLRSKRFAALREERLRIAGGTCERCGNTDRLQLHHRHYQTLGAERIADVEILCNKCHRVATQDQRSRRRALWRGFVGRRRRRA